MKSIYKYDITSNSEIMAPIIRVLSVGEQHGRICLWAEVDLDRPSEKWIFHCLPTGIAVYSDEQGVSIFDYYNYYGTVHLALGSLIYHVYGGKKEDIINRRKPASPATQAMKTQKAAEPKKPYVKPEIMKSKINLDILNQIV